MEKRPTLDEIFKSPIQRDDLKKDTNEEESEIKFLRGKKGERGEKGEKGEKGDKGERGLQGWAGEDGKDGKDGLRGFKGDQGERGFQGEEGKAGKDGKDGMNAKEVKAIALNPKDIVEKINSGKTKIKKDRIEGLEDVENKTASTEKRLQNYISIGGARNTRVASNGTVVATGADTINFIGATVQTPTGNNGSTVDVIITAGGGATIPTGTVNGTNLTFTAATTPTIVFTEAGSYTNGFGVTITGLSIVFAAGLAPQQWIYYI